MEVIIFLVLAVLIIEGIIWLIEHVIGPAAKWILIVVVAAGVLCGAVVALVSYIKSIIANINPYRYYVDKSKNKQVFAKHKSYFFGPGLAQLFKTVKDAWGGIVAALRKIADIRDTIGEWSDGFLRFILKPIAWIFYIVAVISVGLFGGAITCALSIFHAYILFAFMCIIYVLFSFTWVVDRLYLKSKSIKTSCPYDQTRVTVPHFRCPKCGQVHTRLVPGPYGIWSRRCICGEKLPTTFFNGRSKLTALCPTCGTELAASDVQQFSLTIVGGTSSGKTVLISAFYHEFFDLLKKNIKVKYEIPSIHTEMFDNLERWYGGEYCASTAAGLTSDMYSILFKSDHLETDKQFSVYDIAGEAFNDPSIASMLPQKQMRDSNGIVIVIDPLSSMEMLNDAKSEGDDIRNHANDDPSTIISNFIVYLRTVVTNGKLRNRSDKPVAVVISKSDISAVRKRLSYYSIKKYMEANPGEFATFSDARDALSRNFLMDNGLQGAVNAIEAGFSNVHYFPVSAMGHPENGEEYDPEHVVEPFYWLINTTAPDIGSLLGLDD